MGVKALKKRKQELEDELSEVRALLAHAQTKSRIQCRNPAYGPGAGHYGCGRWFQVGRLTYIQTHYYDDNTGSPNGGHYRESEGAFDCPSCGIRIRSYKNPRLLELKRHFKETVKEFPKWGYR